ncbi:MAG: hypothetical protein EXR91_08805 [Gemmatimonadetes bacterium]|nr:hypothetical protein [Gemmatimonadota bacterium]
MWEILGGLLLGTAASGILPLVNAELLAVGVVVAAPEIGVPLVAVRVGACIAGTLTSKGG